MEMAAGNGVDNRPTGSQHHLLEHATRVEGQGCLIISEGG